MNALRAIEMRKTGDGTWQVGPVEYRDCCPANRLSGCCEGRNCQSFNAELERRRSSRKSQRDAEATVRAKQAAERAVLVVLAVLSIAAFLGATAHTLFKADKQIEIARRV